jgi:hypothetical protein
VSPFLQVIGVASKVDTAVVAYRNVLKSAIFTMKSQLHQTKLDHVVYQSCRIDVARFGLKRRVGSHVSHGPMVYRGQSTRSDYRADYHVVTVFLRFCHQFLFLLKKHYTVRLPKEMRVYWSLSCLH